MLGRVDSSTLAYLGKRYAVRREGEEGRREEDEVVVVVVVVDDECL